VVKLQGPLADLMNQGKRGRRCKADQRPGAQTKQVTTGQIEPVAMVTHFASSPVPDGRDRASIFEPVPAVFTQPLPNVKTRRVPPQ
jgi:hypothetical protein